MMMALNVHGEKVFALQFLQARNPDWVRRPFYAKFDPHATWLDDLKPAFGQDKFFFEEEGGSRSEHGHAPGERKVIQLVPVSSRLASSVAAAGGLRSV